MLDALSSQHSLLVADPQRVKVCFAASDRAMHAVVQHTAPITTRIDRAGHRVVDDKERRRRPLLPGECCEGFRSLSSATRPSAFVAGRTSSWQIHICHRGYPAC